EALGEAGVGADVVTFADLWELPPDFQTALYMAPRAGERELKIDMVEQGFHVLRPRGTFLVWSPYRAHPFFPHLLTQVFGRAHTAPHGAKGDPQTVLWAQREGDRPRRRHEVTFHAKVRDMPSCRFLSRPGTFSYGRFDNGARALAEVMEVEPGDRVVDVGCGCGTNGVFAWQQAQPDGHVTFVDSNVRAVALAEPNPRTHGVPAFE